MNKDKVIIMAQAELIKNKKQSELAEYLYKALYEEKRVLSSLELKEYKSKLQEVINGKPIQYVIGNVNFYGHKFNINESVLIPRFETEELVFYTLKYIKEYFDTSISIADIGTGSGVIAITLKKELPSCNLIATDISSSAIDVAKGNAERLGADIKFLTGDMLEPLKGKKVDMLISNPPYIKETEKIEELVSTYEPHSSLYGGSDGLKYYRKIFLNAKSILKDKFMIALEISDSIKDGLLELVGQYFENANFKVVKDMANRDRMLFIFSKID
ncbi:MAG: peptide chain release factor N(5)-glutamine methyltransferase [Bacilli bacterium]|nr:peptide chain release factor N(5)-glutamine methyltransferase [Bacilli bacterium]